MLNFYYQAHSTTARSSLLSGASGAARQARGGFREAIPCGDINRGHVVCKVTGGFQARVLVVLMVAGYNYQLNKQYEEPTSQVIFFFFH